ncbi:molybdopterin-dependent oxidoreductase, partial [Enterobacter intestinihominis]
MIRRTAIYKRFFSRRQGQLFIIDMIEIETSDFVLMFGFNGADCHPIVAKHVMRAKQNGAKIIVCDPRKIETARIADMHIALKNGSNIALLNA